MLIVKILGILIVVSGCNYPSLPDSALMFSPSFVYTHYIRISDEFQALSGEKVWELEVLEDSYMRIEMEPFKHKLTVELKSSSQLLEKETANDNSFAIMSRKLMSGLYNINFIPLDVEEYEKHNYACAKFRLNFQIEPIHNLNKTDERPQYQEGFPNLAKLHDNYESEISYHYIKRTDINHANSILTKHKISLNNTLSLVEVSLYSNFMQNGGLYVILSTGNYGDLFTCTKNCVFSNRINSYFSMITDEMPRGDYYLSFIYKNMKEEEKKLLLNNMYFGFKIAISDIKREKCEGRHLPKSLNTPGLLNDHGFLRYSENLLVDFESENFIQFSLEQNSMMRIHVESINSDIFILNESKITIDKKSNESLLREMSSGHYYLKLSFIENILDTKNCQYFKLEIYIYPMKYYSNLVDFYSLNDCDMADLDVLFNRLKSNLREYKEFDYFSDSYFKLPLKPKMYTKKFDLLTVSYMYIGDLYVEIFSDDLFSVLTIGIEDVVHHRKKFNLKLDPGSYTFKIKAVTDNKLSCIPFQLRILIKPMTREDTVCHNTEMIPYSLNTIGYLGIPNSPFIPLSYFSDSIVMHEQSSTSLLVPVQSSLKIVFNDKNTKVVVRSDKEEEFSEPFAKIIEANKHYHIGFSSYEAVSCSALSISIGISYSSSGHKCNSFLPENIYNLQESDEVFSYGESSRLDHAISFKITRNSAYLIGYLQTDTSNASLQIQIENSKKELIASGYYTNSYVNSVAVYLDKGDYNLIIKEVESIHIIPKCRKFLLNVHVSEKDEFSVINQSDSCLSKQYPEFVRLDQWPTHLNYNIPITSSQHTSLQFYVKRPSSFKTDIKPIENMNFYTKLTDLKDKIVEGNLGPGKYTLRITYEGTTSYQNCPSFDLTLSVVPIKHSNLLKSSYNCTTFSTFPKSITPKRFKDNYIINSKSGLFSVSYFKVHKDSHISISLGYDQSLAGRLELKINSTSYDLYELENMVNLQANLIKGVYELIIENSSPHCWPAIMEVETKKETHCNYPELPFSLVKSQNSDGSIDLYSSYKLKLDDKSHLIKFMVNQESIGKFSVIADFYIEILVFSDNKMNQLIGSSTDGNLVLKLFPSKKPLYLVFKFFSTEKECLKLDFRASIETYSTVQSKLTCKIRTHDPNVIMPPSVIVGSFDPFVFGSDKYAVLRQSKIPFKSTFILPVEAIVSAEINYDYLTNCMQLVIEDEQNNELVSSHWTDLNNDQFNSGHIIEGVVLSPGTYFIKAKQSAEIYEEFSGTCFPFSFNIEAFPTEEIAGNQVIMVDPDHLTFHNPNSGLFIRLSLLDYLPQNIDYSYIVYLSDLNNALIYPVAIDIQEKHIQAQFDSLSAGHCYELNVNYIQSDQLKHSYCTSSCLCNPKASALCDSDMKCICEPPYTGLMCYQCVKGYYLAKSDECIESYTSVDIIDNQEKEVRIQFSSTPFSIDAKELAPEHLKKCIQIVYTDRQDKRSIESATSLKEDKTEWELVISNHQPERDYILKIKNIYDENGIEFPREVPNIKSICQYGEMINGSCSCFSNFSGTDCDICVEEFTQVENLCAKTDENAKINYVIPGGTVFIEDRVSLQVEFSTAPYTSSGNVIDKYTNLHYMNNIFALVDDDLIVYPTSVLPLDTNAKVWKFEFTGLAQERYKFTFIGYLFTADFTIFQSPTFDLPSVLACRNGIVDGNECKCNQGFSGQNCTSSSSVYYYLFFYALTGLIVIFLIYYYKKLPKNDGYEPGEISDLDNDD